MTPSLVLFFPSLGSVSCYLAIRKRMAASTKRLFLCFLIVFLLFVIQVFADAENHGIELEYDDKGGVANVDSIHRRPKINCNFACARRCRKSSRKNLCHRACGTCCMRCHCVPAGTYGNKNSCPCYAKLRTHGGHPKCP